MVVSFFNSRSPILFFRQSLINSRKFSIKHDFVSLSLVFKMLNFFINSVADDNYAFAFDRFMQFDLSSLGIIFD